MVDIAPFKGVMYSAAERAAHGGRLLAPPYDVLSPEEQLKFLELSPHNILHLDYDQARAEDGDKFAWHERSAALLRQWLAEGVLERLEEPAIFHLETICRNPVSGETIMRRGFVCLMRLVDFDLQADVRRHEKTFSSHKEERLSLMKATHANLSHVFGFFPDEDRQVLGLMREAVERRDPEVDLSDGRGQGHRVWIDRQPESIGRLTEALKRRRVYIADGHHRYETAVTYRDFLKDKGEFAPGADYVMIYLCPMSDPGLVILPTHRLLNGRTPHPDDLLNLLSPYFKISGKSFTEKTEPVMRDRFLTKLKKHRGYLGLYLAGRPVYYVLKARESVETELAAQGEPPELAALDTVILSGVIFKKSLGLTEEELDNPEIVSYISDLRQTLDQVGSGKMGAAFILNPSTVEDVVRVCENGLTMPRKSTFFYPKVTTGLVMNILD